MLHGQQTLNVNDDDESLLTTKEILIIFQLISFLFSLRGAHFLKNYHYQDNMNKILHRIFIKYCLTLSYFIQSIVFHV